MTITSTQQTELKNNMALHWSDYTIFATILTIITAMGLYQSVKPVKKAQDTEDYFVGGRNMNYVTMALSLAMTFQSAIGVLGTPAQIYTKGTLFWFIAVGFCLGAMLTGLLLVPLLYPLYPTSATEV